jgi:hypothetical protein
MQLSAFLRTILKLDAASCLAMAAILVPAASMLEPLLGVPATLLASTGVGFVPLGLFILWLGTRREALAALVYLLIAGNLAWVALTLAVASSLPGITGAGTAFIGAQALAVLAITILEYRGARESAATLAAA